MAPPLQTSVAPDASLNPTFQGSLVEAARTNTDTGTLIAGTPAEDGFWYTSEVAAKRWNQSFPYQLRVLEQAPDGSGYADRGTFTLPIPPQELGLTTPFAITTEVTLGGIVEQHNGAPLRTITLTGTTGVWPGRKSLGVFPGLDVSQAVFGGTLSAIGNVLGGVSSVVSTFTGQGGVEPNKSFASATAGEYVPAVQTGYYQMRLLQQFLEAYVASKKTDDGRRLRLAFCLWKDQAVYLVTPVSFDMRRSAASPWEYTYSLQLRAWKRINFPGAGVQPLQSGYTASMFSLQGMARLLRTVTVARDVFQSQNLMAVQQGHIGDVQTINTTFGNSSANGGH